MYRTPKSERRVENFLRLCDEADKRGAKVRAHRLVGSRPFVHLELRLGGGRTWWYPIDPINPASVEEQAKAWLEGVERGVWNWGKTSDPAPD